MDEIGFRTTKIETAMSVGERLALTRRRAGVDLGRIAKNLNIRQDYLKAIEENREEDLPPDIYVRGFIKSYGDFLGLDGYALVRHYQEERQVKEKVDKDQSGEEEMMVSERPKKKRFNFIITPRVMRIGGIVLVVAALLFYLWYQFSGLATAPELTVSSPYNDRTIKEEMILVVGQTHPDAELMINNQPVQLDAEGNFKENIGLQEGLNNIIIVARNGLGKESIAERRIMVEKGEGATPTEAVDILGGEKKCEVTVRIKDKATWVRVERDGELAYSGMMLADSEQTFSAEEKIVLSSGDARATEVIFNGEDLGLMSEVEEPLRDREFVATRENIHDEEISIGEEIPVEE